MAKKDKHPRTVGERQGDNKTRAAGLFGRLREFRARVQSLRELAEKLQQQATAFADPGVRDREMQVSLEENSPILTLNHERMELLVGEIRTLLNESDDLYSGWGDTVGQIQVAWNQAYVDWQKIVGSNAKDCSRQLSRVVVTLDSIIYNCCVITVPDRITAHLKLLPIGGALNFREAYGDELSTTKERQRFLGYLNFYPDFVEGLIDVKSEQIFRAAPAGWRRWLTIAITAALATAGFGLIFLASYLGDLAHLRDWPFTGARLKEHLIGYAFLLIGSLAHVVITLLKQDREASGSFQALSDWVLRIHVKENSFIISAISLWFGSVAMAFLFKDGVDWKAAFFVGYSYDSFIDLFLQRFEATAAVASKAVTEDLASSR
jgi:hypothetical protein